MKAQPIHSGDPLDEYDPQDARGGRRRKPNPTGQGDLFADDTAPPKPAKVLEPLPAVLTMGADVPEVELDAEPSSLAPPGLGAWAHYRSTDPETSRAAAESLDLPSLEGVALAAIIKEGPMTTFEIAAVSGLERDSISPRMKNLVARGLVRDSGEKRIPEGRTRTSIIWELNDTPTPTPTPTP